MNLETKIIENILKLRNTKANASSNANAISKSNKYTKQIPENVFGVFVTIRRSVKLPKYPEDIHGCIGYWSPDYSILTPKEIIKHILDVSNSAMYNDTRREYFPPIKNDPDSIIEIDFMLQPLIKINEKTGKLLPNGEIFKNSKYGLIVEGYDKKRATYLPYVFPDTTKWNKLKESLISKAGTSIGNGNGNGNGNTFLAYTIIQWKAKLFDVMKMK